MSLVVPDSQRKIPLTQIPFADASAAELYQKALDLRRSFAPEYTDESLTDPGNLITWMFCFLVRVAISKMDQIKNDSFLATVTNRASLQRILEPFGYQLGESTAAAADVTFVLEEAHPEYTIPQGTKLSTLSVDNEQPVIFETAADKLVSAGVITTTVSCIQGETIVNEAIGSSDGSTNQRYRISRRPVVWQSESVEVFDGNAWNGWTRISNFVDSTSSDTHYRIEVDADGSYWIVFGNGVTGAVPQRGTSNVRCSYRHGGGIIGNVGAETITELVDSVMYIESLSNVLPASGGTDRETIEHGRLFGPATSRTLQRGVSLSDFETLAVAFSSTSQGAIATARAFVAGGYNVHVMIVPRSGGYPTATLKTELQAHLEAKRVACMNVAVVDPVYELVNIDATIYPFANYSADAVVQEVRTRLVNYISPSYQDPDTGLYPHGFGRDIYVSDIYRIIDETPGVDHVTLDEPAADVIIQDYRIANIGSLTLSVTSAGEEVSFLDINTDLGTGGGGGTGGGDSGSSGVQS